MVEALLWLLGIFIIIWLISNYRRWSAFFRKPSTVRTEHNKPTQTLFGMDVRPESLPEDIPGCALRLWQQHNAAGALSLLYRGALASLINHYKLELNSSATEGDCVVLVSQRTPQLLVGYFRQLTDAWVMTAYAHRPPQGPLFEQLCRGWSGHFEATQ